MAINNTKFDPEGATKPSSVERDVWEKAVSSMRTIQIPLNLQERYAYTAGAVTYAGFAPRGLAEGSDGWLLFKYEYDGTDMIKKTVAYGNWTNRESESYA